MGGREVQRQVPSQEKAGALAEMKMRVSWCRFQVQKAKRRYASKRELAEAVEAYEEAKLAWAALNRNTQHKGVHELLDA